MTLLGIAAAKSGGTWSYTSDTRSKARHGFTRATSAGFPDASTTGVPADTSLTTADLDVYGNFNSSHVGQIIDGLNVEGKIIVMHPNVTIKRTRAHSILAGHDGIDASGLVIEDCEIIGGLWNSGISIVKAPGAVIRRCDISGVERGIWLESDNSLIEENYIHNLINNTGTHDPHIDGIQIPGHGAIVSDVTIRNNNLDLAKDVSASITMRDAKNIIIDGNRLSGGSYVIYFEGNTTGVQVTSNVFGRHYFGYIAGTAARSQTYRGNIFGDPGRSTGTNPPVPTAPARRQP